MSIQTNAAQRISAAASKLADVIDGMPSEEVLVLLMRATAASIASGYESSKRRRDVLAKVIAALPHALAVAEEIGQPFEFRRGRPLDG